MKSLYTTVFFLFMIAAPLYCQVGDTVIGLNNNRSYSDGQFDHVDILNNNLTIAIPLYSLPQRGRSAFSTSVVWNSNRFRYNLVYDPDSQDVTQYYDLTDTNAPFGPTIVYDQNLILDPASLVWAVPECTFSNPDPIDYLPCDGSLTLEENQFLLRSYTGGQHVLLLDAKDHSRAQAVDGSGYSLTNISTDPWALYAAGVYGYIPGDINIHDQYGTTQSYQAISTNTDANGNLISSSVNGGFTDTLGRTIPALPQDPYEPGPVSAQCPNLSVPGQPVIASNIWQVPGPNGTNVAYLVCYAPVTYHTFFFNGTVAGYIPGDPEDPSGSYQGNLVSYDTTGTKIAIQSIVLPDGSYWGFVYDSSVYDVNGDMDPSLIPESYGSITEIRMPTGGAIDYTYNHFRGTTSDTIHSDLAGDLTTISTRSLSDGLGHKGTWTYSGVPIASVPTTSMTAVVTDPNGNDETHTFDIDQNLETGSSIYQGSYSNGKLLMSRTTTYTGSRLGSGLEIGVLPKTVTSTAFGTTPQITTTTNTYAYPFSVTLMTCALGDGPPEPTCGSGSTYAVPFGKPTKVVTVGSAGEFREVDTSYLGLDNQIYAAANILGLPETISTFDAGSHTASSKRFKYDEQTFAPNCLTGVCGLQTTESDWLDVENSYLDSHTYYGNSYGSASILTNPKGFTTSIVYDQSGIFPSSIQHNSTNNTQHIDFYTYDDNTGSVLSHTDWNGSASGDPAHTTQYQYDTMGRLTRVIDPPVTQGQGEVDVCYTSLTGAGCSQGSTPNSSYTSVAFSPGQYYVSRKTSDGLGRLIQSASSNGALVDTAYDIVGNVVSWTNPYYSLSDPTYGVTAATYDAMGRILLQCNPDNGTPSNNCQPGTSYTSTSYDGALSTVTEANGASSERTTNAWGQISSVREADPKTGQPNATTQYSYDTLGNLSGSVQGGVSGEVPRSRAFRYDSLSRLVSSTSPESGTTSYVYDHNGNLVLKTDANNVTTNYWYDELDRNLGAWSTDGSINSGYQYDTGVNANGKLFYSAHWGVGMDAYGYDALGRVQWKSSSSYGITAPWNTTSASYDLAGNTTSLVYPDTFALTETWDAAGRLQTVTSANTPFITGPKGAIEYAPSGALSALSLGLHVNEMLAYNNRLQLCHSLVSTGSLPHKTPGDGNVIDRQAFYGQDVFSGNATACGNEPGNNGKITAIMDSAQPGSSQSFTYDFLNRLATGNRSDGAYNHNYHYDSFGNLLIEDGPNSAVYQQSWIDPSTNRLLRATSGIKEPPYSVITYDADGNMTSSGPPDIGGHSLAYNAANQITSVDGGAAATYYYNASGEREFKVTQSGTTTYTYWNGQLIAEQDNTGQWTKYLSFNGQKVAKLTSRGYAIHLTGENSGSNVASGVLLPGINGLTVRAGDTLRWWQYTQAENGQSGGIWIGFTDGNFSTLGQRGASIDTDGQGTNSDAITNQWHLRTTDLSQFQGETVSVFQLLNERWNAIGNFDFWFSDLVLERSDGSVIPIWTGNVPASSFSAGVYGPGQATASVDGTLPTGVDSSFLSTHFYVGDQVGTTGVELSSFGVPLWKGQFTPFGQELPDGSTSMHYKFTGKERDSESGLDNFGARYYGSSMGRFMSPDDGSDQDPTNPQSWNLYSYVQNNPLTNTDPDGHTCQTNSTDGTTYDDMDGKGCDAVDQADAQRLQNGDYDANVNGGGSSSLGTAASNVDNFISGAASSTMNFVSQVGSQLSNIAQTPGGIGCMASLAGSGGMAGAAAGGSVGLVGLAGGGVGVVVTEPAGLLIGGAGGAASGLALGMTVCPGGALAMSNSGKGFGGNQRENKQANDAKQEAERDTGKKFDRALDRKFHDEITGQGYGYHELVEIAKQVLQGHI